MLGYYEQIWTFSLIDLEKWSKFVDLNSLQRVLKEVIKSKKKISTFYWDIAETQKFVCTCPQMYVGTYPELKQSDILPNYVISSRKLFFEIFLGILYEFLEDSLEAIEVDKFWPIIRIDQVKSSNLFIIT